MIITIDGPAASGKSSLARELANKFGIYYLNSGLLYRGLAYVLINNFDYSEFELKDPKNEDINKIFNVDEFVYCYDGQKESLKYNNLDVTQFLKTPQIDKTSSILSSNSEVRSLLLKYQREFATKFDLVTDGRDCGTIVFPNADIKIFLTASIKVRALRWQHDMELKGMHYELQKCEAIISERDKRDQEREIASLKIPKDAIFIDNSDLSQAETFNKILDIINNS